MHLSLLSDTGFAHQHRTERSLGRAHRDGLLRGLAFLAIIAVPFGLAVATGHAGHRDASAGYAQTFEKTGFETVSYDAPRCTRLRHFRSILWTVVSRRRT